MRRSELLRSVLRSPIHAVLSKSSSKDVPLGTAARCRLDPVRCTATPPMLASLALASTSSSTLLVRCVSVVVVCFAKEVARHHGCESDLHTQCQHGVHPLRGGGAPLLMAAAAAVVVMAVGSDAVWLRAIQGKAVLV